jgi:hypothetical protein
MDVRSQLPHRVGGSRWMPHKVLFICFIHVLYQTNNRLRDFLSFVYVIQLFVFLMFNILWSEANKLYIDYPGVVGIQCLGHRLELAFKGALKKDKTYDKLVT